MKKNEMYTELSIQLARIEDKLNQLFEEKNHMGLKELSLDRLLEDYKNLPNLLPDSRVGCDITNEEPKQRCYFESMSLEDLMKPMSISCSCKRCSPYSMADGSIQSVD